MRQLLTSITLAGCLVAFSGCSSQGADQENFPDPATIEDTATRYTLPSSRVTIPMAGAFEWFMAPVDNGTDLFRGLWPGADLRDMKPAGGIGRPKFVPLYIVHRDDEWLFGTPRVDVRVAGTSAGNEMPVFVALGVQHANKRRVHLAGKPLTALPTKGIHDVELPVVSQTLKAGDRVGLVIYGFSNMAPLQSGFWARTASLKGDVWLPLAYEADLQTDKKGVFTSGR